MASETSQHDTSQPDASQSEELGRLIAALLDGGLEPADRRRLEAMLLGDPAAVEYYQNYLDVHVLLHWQQGLAERQPARGESADGLSPVSPDTSAEPAASAGGRLLHPSSFILHPFTALECLAGSAAFSYLVAAALLGAGILLAGQWQSRVGRGANAAVNAPPVFVAKITKAQDCHRGDPGPWAADGLSCRLGFQCYVDSGQLEITYDTGAKVTLQGPAWYEVSSPRGGSLYEGTAVISVGEQGNRAQPPRKAVAPRVIVDHPLFTLHTRAGLLTNQAAEFSLTVDAVGAFFAKVKRGQVALQMPGWGSDEAVAIGEAHSAVTLIQPFRNGGFHWELRLSGDEPLLVDSNPHHSNQSAVAFSGKCHGNTGKWGLEKPPGHGSGS